MTKYFKELAYVSVLIFFYQGVSNAVFGITGQFAHQAGKDWVGPLFLAMLFLGCGLGSIYNKYIGRYQYNLTFFVGGFGNALYILMELVLIEVPLSLWVILMLAVGGFVSGLIASIFFNSFFNFINVLSKIDGKEVQYFGIAFLGCQGSGLFGNLLSSLLIVPLGQLKYIITMTGIVVFFCLLFLRVKTPNEQDELVEEKEKEKEKEASAENA